MEDIKLLRKLPCCHCLRTNSEKATCLCYPKDNEKICVKCHNIEDNRNFWLGQDQSIEKNRKQYEKFQSQFEASKNKYIKK